MTLSIVQSDIVWADPAGNHRRLDGMVEGLPDTDLIVLPEMFSTGFATKPEGIAEEGGEPSLGWMRAVASRRDCAVAGSVAVHDADGYHNRFYFVTPDGKPTHYDKRHLFTFSGEDKAFTPGSDKVTVEWRGLRIRLQVCYDLRFPAFSRNSLEDRYDLLLYVASWPAVRAKAWKSLLTARAIENQCFVAGVNRVGTDPGNSYSGDSVVLDWNGEVLCGCRPSEPQAVTCELNLQGLEAARKAFPVLADADRPVL